MWQRNVAGNGRPSAPDIIIWSQSEAVDTRPYDRTPNHTVVAYPTTADGDRDEQPFVADFRALAHQQNSDLLHPISETEN